MARGAGPIRSPSDFLTLEELLQLVEREEIARELWPEALVLLEALPHNVGGKIAKSALREDAQTRFGTGLDADTAAHARAASRREAAE